ncbi:hypothetical protein VB636_03705, partial [Paracoccus sp. APAP_BH8]
IGFPKGSELTPKVNEALAKLKADVRYEEHDGMLRIILPDTYGTQGFLEHAPDWLAGWTGIRVDSGDPAVGASFITGSYHLVDGGYTAL